MGGYWFSDLEFRVERFRVRRLAGLGLGRGGLASKARGLMVEGLADQDYGIQGCCSKFRLGAEGRLGAYWPKIAAWFCRGLVQRF